MTPDAEVQLKTCSLCGTQFSEWGNNPDPLANLETDGPCCDVCNDTKVIPARLGRIMEANFKQDAGDGLANGEFGQGKTPPGWEATDGR